MLLKLLLVMLIAMFPLVELRGAIPIAASMNLPVAPSLIAAMIGNIIPMPLIFLFGRSLLDKGSKTKSKIVRDYCKWCIEKGNKASEKLQTKTNDNIYIALIMFVGIPLPGTGAWTGMLAATFLNLDYKKSLVAICGGTFLAGVIMMAISFGLFDLIS